MRVCVSGSDQSLGSHIFQHIIWGEIFGEFVDGQNFFNHFKMAGIVNKVQYVLNGLAYITAQY